MATRVNADIQVSPAEDRAIATAARKAGLSKRGWISQVVRERINQVDDTARITQVIDRLDAETRGRSEQATKQTLEVIRLEAARLTDYVVDAMHNAMPAPIAPVSKEKSAEWGELTGALQKLGEAVVSQRTVPMPTLEKAIAWTKDCQAEHAAMKKKAQATQKEWDDVQRRQKIVLDKCQALAREADKAAVAHPQLEHLFELFRIPR